MEAFPDGYCGDVALTYAVEPEPLDTAGAIRFAAEFAGIDDTFVVANGDVMTDLDVAELIAAHRAFGAEATLHLIGVDDPSAFGVVDLADDGGVRAFVEKPAPGTEPSNLINAGTYVFEPSVLDRIPAATKVSVERDTFQRVVADGGLYGLATDDYWIDAGVPALYRSANLDLLDGKRRTERCEAIAPGAEVAEGATITHSIIGSGALGRRRRHGGRLGAPPGSIGRGRCRRRAIAGDGRGRTVPRSCVMRWSVPRPRWRRATR